MMQKIQKVLVRSANGGERVLALMEKSGQTAYVCALERHAEAINDRDWWVGFPLADVRFLAKDKAAN